MINNIFILACSLIILMKGATLATKYAGAIAESFRLSKYAVGFIMIAIISILPEAFIVADAAYRGIPEFGLGTLFGSNFADLTLIFALIIFLAGRRIKVESRILKNSFTYPLILLMPLLLGADGYFSRLEGLALIIVGGIFYYISLKDGVDNSAPAIHNGNRVKNSLLLLAGMAMLLVGANFVVSSASDLALNLGVSSILVGMLIVGLGTTIPELVFALESVKKRDDSLAVGDILGTVMADATIVVGLIALISPFAFPKAIIYVTGAFMVAASVVLFRFMKTDKLISKREAYYLLVFWLIFVLVQFFTSKYLV